MNIGFMGLGKLGLPVALAVESKGHTVLGCDPSETVRTAVETRTMAYMEDGGQAALGTSDIRLVPVKGLVAQSDIIFVAVQTPHDPLYDGSTPRPTTRRDFDYTYLESAVSELAAAIQAHGESRTVVIISTVLPGTIRRKITPLLSKSGDLVRLCYNPFFISMGTTIKDFLHPEFVLVGAADTTALETLGQFYDTIHNKPRVAVTIENAELIKCLYNTFISLKLAFANTVMEICHKTPNTSCDVVIDSLSQATERVVSPKYMRGGMGDGGACHPRDNIALSWLAGELQLSHDLFNDVMTAREDQTRWLADLIISEHRQSGLPIVLLGQAFKANTNISTGSPALLLSHYLTARGYTTTTLDPFVRSGVSGPTHPALFFISTRHDCWQTFNYPEGSIVIDPWRYLPSLKSVRYLPVGVCQ